MGALDTGLYVGRMTTATFPLRAAEEDELDRWLATPDGERWLEQRVGERFGGKGSILARFEEAWVTIDRLQTADRRMTPEAQATMAAFLAGLIDADTDLGL